ncbi:polyprenyl synthetase family protein [Streptomyces sp. NPDC006477]|uniref:polyprenyl synthetase family protein n=1 Tax=Streptomyces sp. NPDC006477 TaxID=3364747 RepID=UPI00369C7142
MSRRAILPGGQVEQHIELIVGQYLDLCASGEDAGTVDDAMQMIHFKTTKYTVERPMQIGAALAGADGAVLEACSAYARPLGEAFQLLDDLEDVIKVANGSTDSGTDQREGKHTTVLALAAANCDTASGARLRQLVGDRNLDAEQLAEVRAIIAGTGPGRRNEPQKPPPPRPPVRRSPYADEPRRAARAHQAAPAAAQAPFIDRHQVDDHLRLLGWRPRARRGDHTAVTRSGSSRGVLILSHR